MSFGFSISDFFTCAQVTWQLYDALKTGPAECQAFAKEVLLFHQVLEKMCKNLQGTTRRLSLEEHDALSQHVVGFEELCSLIMDDTSSTKFRTSSTKFLTHMDLCGLRAFRYYLDDLRRFDDENVNKESGIVFGIMNFRDRIRTASFAKKIPKLQRAITAQVEKLTAFNVLLIQSNQDCIQESQQRTEYSQIQMTSAQERLEESQARIEVQLKAILGSQQRQGTPLLSNSLDASSPEGHQTWMNLGRTLREEGITPTLIKKNQNLLIRAMKDTLCREASLSDSFNESYQTALEYHVAIPDDEALSASIKQGRDRLSLQSYFSPRGSIPLFGSAPPSAATFSSEFLQRHVNSTGPLDQDQNIASGIISLLQGMNRDNAEAYDYDDFTEAEELTDADVITMTEDVEGW